MHVPHSPYPVRHLFFAVQKRTRTALPAFRYRCREHDFRHQEQAPRAIHFDRQPTRACPPSFLAKPSETQQAPRNLVSNSIAAPLPLSLRVSPSSESSKCVGVAIKRKQNASNGLQSLAAPMTMGQMQNHVVAQTSPKRYLHEKRPH